MSDRPAAAGRQRLESKGGCVGVLGVFDVFCSFTLALLLPAMGVRRLTSAIGSPYESRRVVAFMALIRLGPRIAPRLLAAIDRRHPQSPALIKVLGNQEDPSIVPRLEQLAACESEEIATAARAAIDNLRSTHFDRG